jgi:LysM repeat protein
MFAKRMIQLTLILVLVVVSVAATHSNAAAWSCGSTYVVQPGDWLSKIANRCGVSLSQLYAANPNVGYYIYPGQVLYIYGGTGYTGPVPGSGWPVPGNGAPNPGHGSPWYGNGHYYCGPTSNSYYGNYYVVCRGDTLLQIALYYGERLSYMQWHNHIYNANRIYAGQFIFP